MGLSNDNRVQNSRSESDVKSPVDDFKEIDEEYETISTYLICSLKFR